MATTLHHKLSKNVRGLNPDLKCLPPIRYLVNYLANVSIIDATGKCKEINLLNDNEHAQLNTTNRRKEYITDAIHEILISMLWIKDSNGVSDNAYHELSALCSNMPRLWILKTCINEINKQG